MRQGLSTTAVLCPVGDLRRRQAVDQGANGDGPRGGASRCACPFPFTPQPPLPPGGRLRDGRGDPHSHPLPTSRKEGAPRPSEVWAQRPRERLLAGLGGGGRQAGVGRRRAWPALISRRGGDHTEGEAGVPAQAAPSSPLLPQPLWACTSRAPACCPAPGQGSSSLHTQPRGIENTSLNPVTPRLKWSKSPAGPVRSVQLSQPIESRARPAPSPALSGPAHCPTIGPVPGMGTQPPTGYRGALLKSFYCEV